MTEAIHWDKIAKTYEDEIFDVFKSNKNGKLQTIVQKYAGKGKFAVDFGCGTGKALSMLSPLFYKVLAVDISQKCLNIASVAGYKNVEFDRVDLAAPKNNIPPADFAFCCNVAIGDDNKRNFSILKNVLKSLKKGGTAVIVIPSLESASFSSWQMIRVYESEGVKPTKIPKAEFDHLTPAHHNLIQKGIFYIDGHPTKHYLFAELYSFLNDGKFAVQNIDRLEYSWATEFTSPPKWLRDPYPWDWVVEVKRVK
ncbi:MAG: class I SAM-dependent methyltransferase [Bacteroidetes bacterium]|nr:class I SAM-dependent methyltransferase [Bacteroidota bacterium]MBK9543348.1 class I SAM-dependent methyltransferase [Bacteroidota bacterium]MBP6649768.1 class I SAM-dependent methyltransferase [Bacteroidia bacterium]